MAEAGWDYTRAELRAAVRRMLGGAYEEFVGQRQG